MGEHDTKHDVQPEIDTMFVVKFKDESSDVYFACATLRPETIEGVTNIFIGENVEYVIAKLNGERLYMSKEAAETLRTQMNVETEKSITAAELMHKNAINPVNGEKVPLLPGFFVKAGIGTGVVMSVPSHAPFDYATLERLKSSGYPMPKMEYRKLIEIDPDGRAASRSAGLWATSPQGRPSPSTRRYRRSPTWRYSTPTPMR